MSIKYGVIGAFTIDNVINQKGEIGVYQCGGNAYYAAAGARLWSDEVGVVARIGEDYPRSWVKELEDAGVDITGVREIPGPHQMHGGMIYDTRGDRTGFDPRDYFREHGQTLPLGMLPDFPSRNPEIQNNAQMAFAPDPEDVPKAYLSATSFHLSPRYYVKHQRSISFLKEHEIHIFMDPGVWYMREKNEEKVAILFKNVDVVLPSEVEVRALYGEGDLFNMMLKLANLGPRVVVVKIGPQGSLVYDKNCDRFFQVPVYPANVIDPTGAGDSYCGGFMVGFTETNDPLIAAIYGTVSSSFIIEGFGAPYSLQFTRAKAQERLEKMIELSKNKYSI